MMAEFGTLQPSSETGQSGVGEPPLPMEGLFYQVEI